MGFTLIEIMFAIIILGIIFGLGGPYLISLWREHRISVQNDFLQREAAYALDFIINGQRMEDDTNEIYRYGGIIASYDVNIDIISKDIHAILLYRRIKENSNKDPMIGRIYPDSKGRHSLWIDYSDGTRHRIIPTGASEAGITDPYTITKFLFEPENDDSFYSIEISLEQIVSARKLTVNMKSGVNLRNK